MITAIDSSVLISILNRETESAAWQRLLTEAAKEGLLVICPVVFAECGTRFPSLIPFQKALDLLQISFDPISEEASYTAGQIFKRYRQEGGPRQNLIPDFIVAAHAAHQSNQLATIDRGYFRRYFPYLKILSPSS